jgi:hypothetical protein
MIGSRHNELHALFVGGACALGHEPAKGFLKDEIASFSIFGQSKYGISVYLKSQTGCRRRYRLGDFHLLTTPMSPGQLGQPPILG